jgi:hypothetical protein
MSRENNMTFKRYDDEEIADFLELATEIGIARAIRQLGYPNSWGTAKRWADARGIVITVDDLKAKAKEFNDWYDTEELLIIAQDGMQRIHEQLQEKNLSPDEQKRLSEAFQKYVNTWSLLKGKATAITETRQSDGTDIELIELLNEEKARNAMIESKEDETITEK